MKIVRIPSSLFASSSSSSSSSLKTAPKFSASFALPSSTSSSSIPLSSCITTLYTLPKRYRGGGSGRAVIYKVSNSAKQANKNLDVIAAHNQQTNGGNIGDARTENIPISGIGAVFGFSINRDIDSIAHRTKNVQLREHLRTIDLDDLPIKTKPKTPSSSSSKS